MENPEPKFELETFDLIHMDQRLMIEKDTVINKVGKPSNAIKRTEQLPASFNLEKDVEGKYEPVQLMVEGFTPGASKNVLILLNNELKVYSVNKESINFESRSELERDTLEGYGEREKTRLHFRQDLCLLYVYQDLNKPARVLRLDPDSGRVLSEQNFDLNPIKMFRRLCPEQTFDMIQIDHFPDPLAFFSEPMVRQSTDRVAYLFRVIGARPRLWMVLRASGDLLKSYRKTLGFPGFYDNIYETESEFSKSVTDIYPYAQDSSLIIIKNRNDLIFKILCFRTRKVLRTITHCFNKLLPTDTITDHFKNLGKKVKRSDLVNCDIKARRNNTYYNQTKDRLFAIAERYRISFVVSFEVDMLFYKDPDSFLFLEEKLKSKHQEEADYLFGLEDGNGDGRLYLESRKSSSYLEYQTRKWPQRVDLDSLEQTKLIGNQDSLGFDGLCSNFVESVYTLPQNFEEKFFIFLNNRFISVYDTFQDKFVHLYDHTPEMGYHHSVKLTDFDNHVSWTCADNLIILQYTELWAGPENEDMSRRRFQKLIKIHLYDHFVQDRRFRLLPAYSLLKLSSGRWLFLGGQEDRTSPHLCSQSSRYTTKMPRKALRGIAMEICPKTFKVIKTIKTPKEQNLCTQNLDFNQFHRVDGDLLITPFYVDQTKQGKWRSYFLSLWDKNLSLVDTCTSYHLKDFKSIKLVDGSFAIGRSILKDYYLFKIDFEGRKVVPMKAVSLNNRMTLEEVLGPVGVGKELRCMTRCSRGKEREFLMRFNSRLELLSWTNQIRTVNQPY